MGIWGAFFVPRYLYFKAKGIQQKKISDAYAVGETTEKKPVGFCRWFLGKGCLFCLDWEAIDPFHWRVIRWATTMVALQVYMAISSMILGLTFTETKAVMRA